MEVNKERVAAVMKDIEALSVFGKFERFPNAFYRLNQDEQKEVVRQYKERFGEGRGKPFTETK